MSDNLGGQLNVGGMAPNESDRMDVGAGSRQPRSILGLPQRIADCDPATKEKIRQKVKNDIFANPAPMMPYVFFNLSLFSFLLPEHWGLQPVDFVKVLERAVIDTNVMKYFQDKGIINWSSSTVKLYPLRTTGDGNCLMHAISLFLWGIEDLDLQMRRILYQDIFSDNAVKQYKKRWQLGRTAFDQGIPSTGLRYDTMNWDDEWKLVVRNSSPEPNPDDQNMLPYHSLEEIHIFIMANILRRPIIVLADTMFRDYAGRSLQPQNVTGIYLPVLCKPEDCCTFPVVLGYHQNHFVPLVGKKLLPDERLEMVLPLCSKNFEGFPVHFLLPEEEQSKQRLLESYLSQKQLQQSGSSHTILSIQGATLGVTEFVESVSIMKTYFKLAEKKYQDAIRNGAPIAAPFQRCRLEKPSDIKPCLMCNKNPAEGENDVCKQCLVTNCTSFHPSASAPPQSLPLGSISKELGNLNLEAQNYPESELRVPAQNPSYKSPATATGIPCLKPQNQVTQQQGLGAERQDLLDQKARFAQQGYSICVERPCKTAGCNFYCSSELPGDFCHSCTKDASPMGQHVRIEKCRTEGCWNQANPDRRGLCNLCSGTHHLKKQVPPQVVGYNLPSQIPTVSGFPPSNQGRPSGLEDPSGLNSLAILQTSVGSKKCNEPTCKLTGQDALQGFCRKCYDKNITIHKRVENIPPEKSVHDLKKGSREGVRSMSGIQSGVIGSGQQKSAVTYEKSIEPCKTPNCALYGTNEQNGYCTKCLEEILYKDAEKQNVCKSRCCGKKAFQEGYCNECFEHTPNLAGGSLPAEIPFQLAAPSNVGQVSNGLLLNTCITNGCDSLIVTLGDRRHCLECHQRQSSKNQLSPQILVKCVYPKCSEQTPREQPICLKCQQVLDANRSEQAVKANTISLAPSAVLKVPCTRCCNRFAGSDGLCNQCRDEKKIDYDRNKELEKEPPKCKNKGCDMYGTSAYQGYCSICHLTKSKRTHSEPIKPSPKMFPEEEEYKNRRCVNGCGNWANVKVLDGFCNNCYQLYKTDYPGMIPQTAKVGNPAVSREERKNKYRTDQNCFNPECLNRGNPRSHGFCNSCYAKLQRN